MNSQLKFKEYVRDLLADRLFNASLVTHNLQNLFRLHGDDMQSEGNQVGSSLDARSELNDLLDDISESSFSLLAPRYLESSLNSSLARSELSSRAGMERYGIIQPFMPEVFDGSEAELRVRLEE